MAFGNVAIGATQGDLLDRLGPSKNANNLQLAALLRGREQRKAHAQNPAAFGKQEEQRALDQGVDPFQAIRLGRQRAKGSRRFQDFSRNTDPLTGEHFLDFVDNANRLTAINALLSGGRAPSVGGIRGGFGPSHQNRVIRR